MRSIVFSFLMGGVVGWYSHQYWKDQTSSHLNSSVIPRIAETSEPYPSHKTGESSDSADSSLSQSQQPPKGHSQIEQSPQERLAHQQQAVHQQIKQLLDQNRYTDAQQQLEQWLLIAPDDLDASILYAKVLAAQQEFIPALIHLYDLTAYVDGGNAKALYDVIAEIVERAEQSLRLNNGVAAVAELFEQLVVLHPQHVPYFLKLARWSLELGRIDRAEQAIASTIHDTQWDTERKALESRIKRLKQGQNAQQIVIPLIQLGQHYVVEAMINDQVPVKLLIDTGATNTVIKPHIIELGGLSNGSEQSITMNTANGEVQAYQLVVDRFGLRDQDGLSDSAVVEPLTVGVLSLDGLQADGLLGMNVLRHFEFYIDQSANRLVLIP